MRVAQIEFIDQRVVEDQYESSGLVADEKATTSDEV